MSTALLIIDIQNDYFPGGAMEPAGSTEPGARAGKLLDTFRGKLLPVIHVQHLSTRHRASFFVPGTRGVEIHPYTVPLDGEPSYARTSPTVSNMPVW
jgi:nicotinamidase-related amidase